MSSSAPSPSVAALNQLPTVNVDFDPPGSFHLPGVQTPWQPQTIPLNDSQAFEITAPSDTFALVPPTFQLIRGNDILGDLPKDGVFVTALDFSGTCVRFTLHNQLTQQGGGHAVRFHLFENAGAPVEPVDPQIPLEGGGGTDGAAERSRRNSR